MTLYSLFVFGALMVMLTIALVNAASMPRLGRTVSGGRRAHPRDPLAPTVSILIPARNEARVIGRTLANLRAQNHPIREILVLDDHSEDGTASVVREQAQRGARQGHSPALRLLAGAPLPAGWGGKNWAWHQLADAAVGDVLIFTDADVTWRPGALEAALSLLESSQADLLTVWPTQETVTWAERLIVPLMAVAVVGYLPLPFAHRSPYALATAANGQCMIFRVSAYRAIGGHKAVADQIVEDVQLARRVKAHGLRVWLADGNNLIRCRMYDGWHAVFDGYTKNILAGHGNSAALLLLSTFFHVTVFVMPWVWLLSGQAWTAPGWPWVPLTLGALGIGVRALTAQATGQRVRDALLMPLSVLLMSVIALRSLWWHAHYGGPVWKGRVVGRGIYPDDVETMSDKHHA